MSVFEYLMQVKREKGAGYLTLLDPDRMDSGRIVRRAVQHAQSGADAILIGTSCLLSSDFDATVKAVRSAVDVPVILFPGGLSQLSPHADAILFLSLISGRNPELLIGQQVKAAPLIKHYALEPISTGYILVESGTLTTVEYVSATRPVPRGKSDLAMALALAAEYLGMKLVYLEAGSGAHQSVPEAMIRSVADYVSLPLIVGGGIRRPEHARDKVLAGASFVVVGNILEQVDDPGLLQDLADAVHVGGQRSEVRGQRSEGVAEG